MEMTSLKCAGLLVTDEDNSVANVLSANSLSPSAQAHHARTAAIDTAAVTKKSWRFIIFVYVALVLAQIMFSASHICIKYTLQFMPSFCFSFIRFNAAVIVYTAIMAAVDREAFTNISWNDHYQLMALALVGNLIPFQLLQIAIGFCDAGIAGMLQPVTPVFAALFAVLLKRERATYGKAGGIALSVAGSLCMVFGSPAPANSSGGSNNTLGIILILIQATSIAVTIVAQKPILQRVSIIAFNFWTFAYGAIGHSIIGIYFMVEQDWTSTPPLTIPAMLWTILGATIGAYLLFTYATKHLPASVAALGVCLQGVFSPLFGMIVFGEIITALQITGGFAIAGGIIAVVIARRNEQPVAPVDTATTSTIQEDGESTTNYVKLNEESVHEHSNGHTTLLTTTQKI